MFNNLEPNINYNYKRNLTTGEFTVEVLADANPYNQEVVLEEGKCYITIPTDGRNGYVFKVLPHGLYYFQLKRSAVQDGILEEMTKVEFHIIVGEISKYRAQIKKMLDRALFTEDNAETLYRTLKLKIANEDAFN